MASKWQSYWWYRRCAAAPTFRPSLQSRVDGINQRRKPAPRPPPPPCTCTARSRVARQRAFYLCGACLLWLFFSHQCPVQHQAGVGTRGLLLLAGLARRRSSASPPLSSAAGWLAACSAGASQCKRAHQVAGPALPVLRAPAKSKRQAGCALFSSSCRQLQPASLVKGEMAMALACSAACTWAAIALFCYSYQKHAQSSEHPTSSF